MVNGKKWEIFMLDDKIIYFFKKREGVFVSGEDLSSELGVSRAAVWKHIEKLREEGYEIEAFPHLGYKLISVPDRLTEIELKWQLGTQVVGKKIYSYKEVASTNDVAYNLALQGEKEGSVIIAESQTHGKGRLARKWVSPKGKGLYFSVILRPDILFTKISVITLLSALSVAEAIKEELGLNSLIKWPNDVLINGGKVCGILTEMNGEADKVNFVVVGIGININTSKDILPKEATSIAVELGKEISRIEFTKLIFRSLDKYYNYFKNGRGSDIIKRYKDMAMFLDKKIQVTSHNNKIEGYAVDVDIDGALILKLGSGAKQRVLAGDVSVFREE